MGSFVLRVEVDPQIAVIILHASSNVTTLACGHCRSENTFSFFFSLSFFLAKPLTRRGTDYSSVKPRVSSAQIMELW